MENLLQDFPKDSGSFSVPLGEDAPLPPSQFTCGHWKANIGRDSGSTGTQKNADFKSITVYHTCESGIFLIMVCGSGTMGA